MLISGNSEANEKKIQEGGGLGGGVGIHANNHVEAKSKTFQTPDPRPGWIGRCKATNPAVADEFCERRWRIEAAMLSGAQEAVTWRALAGFIRANVLKNPARETLINSWQLPTVAKRCNALENVCGTVPLTTARAATCPAIKQQRETGAGDEH